MSRNAGSGEIGRFDEILLTILTFGEICEFVQILGRTGESGEIWTRLLTDRLSEYLQKGPQQLANFALKNLTKIRQNRRFRQADCALTNLTKIFKIISSTLPMM